MHSAYNLGPLYAQGKNGHGETIAIMDSYGSDTIAHDLHVSHALLAWRLGQRRVVAHQRGAAENRDA